MYVVDTVIIEIR